MVRLILRGASIVTILAAVTVPALAASHDHRGSGYGVAGGVDPELALASAYSGIYGLGYTFDREHLHDCLRDGAVRDDHRVLTVPGCR